MRSQPLFLALLLALALGGGCRSAPPGPAEGDSPYRRQETPAAPSIGFFLAEFDASLRAWTRLRLTSNSDTDARTLRILEEDMRRRAIERRQELVDELEFGPPKNRPVAAAALGFTGDASVQGPLLNALSDEDAAVVQHALLALGLLGLPETPTAQIAHILRHHPEAWTRNNAAYALQRITLAGGREEGVATSCREALFDQEPGVRAQAASVLGILADESSLGALRDLLYDDYNLVAAAAAASVAHIGTLVVARKGEAARLLVDALGPASSSRRTRLLLELARLSGVSYGQDVQAWRDWAYRLP